MFFYFSGSEVLVPLDSLVLRCFVGVGSSFFDSSFFVSSCCFFSNFFGRCSCFFSSVGEGVVADVVVDVAEEGAVAAVFVDS